MIYQRSQAIPLLNELYRSKTPFVLITDFMGDVAWIKPTSDIGAEEIQYHFPNLKARQKTNESKELKFKKDPVSFQEFSKAFNQVVHEIKIGNSYLTNLTFKTPIHTNFSLNDIFDRSEALYQIKFKDQFVVFSPETFVRIEGEKIYSYPMKGTIDAAIPNAKKKILADHKEMSEHITIVDLIRNDLSQIADQVRVTKFRFLSTVKTYEKHLLQVSSEISGILYHPDNLGSNLFSLLPAGSISGAPKKQTLEIIRKVEREERGYFTGICGCFNGDVFDSGVMIRFIEKIGDQLFFRSGGGITALSDAKNEYQEMIDKVYVPIS